MTRAEWLSYFRIKLQQLSNKDCGSNSCLFYGRGKGGMRVNGGCQCFSNMAQELTETVLGDIK
jgi:hypothetical protein